jgi:uncharacterized membrane-anchored protein YjiN (DUF445 family)
MHANSHSTRKTRRNTQQHAPNAKQLRPHTKSRKLIDDGGATHFQARTKMTKIPEWNTNGHMGKLFQICTKYTATKAAFMSIISQLEKSTYFHLIEEAVEGVIANLKDNKAAILDSLYSEHLKDSTGELLTIWTELFNRCMELGTIPQKWRRSMVKVLYKGKGDADDANKYQADILGMLTIQRLLKKRLLAITENVMPDEHFGCRPRRTLLQSQII